MDFKMPERAENSHKGTFGRVLNVSGSDYMPGAAYLSSVAALTTGCGYVFLCSTERVINAVAAQTQNVVFCPLSDLENQLEFADVLLIGCGLTTSNSACDIFELAVKNAPPKMLIDADALNILSLAGGKILKQVQNDISDLILTPHPKEAARLLGVDLGEILLDLEASAKEISKKYNCVTVLKSHKTVVCSKDLDIYINNSGNNALAKAGSGDVLAGIIAGLLAQKCEPFYAAKLGVYLHGLAGDLAKNDLTEYGVLASDQIRYIPFAIKNIIQRSL